MRNSALAASAFLALAACQTPAGPMPMAFDASAAAYASGTGTGAIAGQAFMRQVGGAVVTAAGSSVALMPDQAYTRELMRRDIAGQIVPDGDVAAVGPFARTTVADASGNFAFRDLPAGKYILTTTVSWGVPTQYGVMPQGGSVASPVVVQNGQVTQIILTR